MCTRDSGDTVTHSTIHSKEYRLYSWPRLSSKWTCVLHDAVIDENWKMEETTTTTTELHQHHRHSKVLKVSDLIGSITSQDEANNHQDELDGDQLEGTSSTHISCLYPEILAIIFGMLEVRDRGRAAQVCISWREAAYHRSVWRRCEPKLHLRRANPSLFPSLVRRGIRRVQILSLRRSLRDVIQGLPNLESLDLSGCFNVTDIGIAHALTDDVNTLRKLNLSLCKQITDSSLGRLAQVKSFYFSLNMFTY